MVQLHLVRINMAGSHADCILKGQQHGKVLNGLCGVFQCVSELLVLQSTWLCMSFGSRCRVVACLFWAGYCDILGVKED